MQRFLGLTIATFLAFFILVAHGLPITNTHLNKRGDDPLEAVTDKVDHVLGEVTDNDALENVTDNDVLENVTDNDVLENVTDNDVLENVTDNDVLENVTDNDVLGDSDLID